MKRKIIKIDEDKCTGCGVCVSGCLGGVLKIENGKAKVYKEFLCDGMGVCVNKCPEGAITVRLCETDKTQQI